MGSAMEYPLLDAQIPALFRDIGHSYDVLESTTLLFGVPYHT
jgi:hypothetical protein